MKAQNQDRKARGRKFLWGMIRFLVIPLLLGIFIKWYWGVGFFGLMFVISLLGIRKRKYLIKDTEGKPVKTREFFRRWKQGIEGITPVQQDKTQILGTWIVLSGIIGGIIVNAIVHLANQWWWIEIILGGSLILSGIQFIGTLQKYWRHKAIENAMKEAERNMEVEE